MSLSDEEKVLDYTGIDGVRGVLVYYPKEEVKEFIKKIKGLRIVMCSLPMVCPICNKEKKLWIRKDKSTKDTCFDCAIDEEAGPKLAVEE